MKQIIAIGIMGVMAASVWAADPKEEVQKAAKALADKDNYAWTQTSKNQGGGGGGGGRGFGAGTMEGKSNKDGVTYIVSKFTNQNGDDMTFESASKGEKRAFKGQDGWQAPGGGGGGGGGGGRGRGMFGGRNPVAQVDTLLTGVKELKSEDGVYSGDLTEDGVKSLMAFGGGRRGGGGGGGGNAPQVTGAKGWAKFWVKDGVLSKIEYNVQGKRTFNEQEVEVNRTTTIDIKNVGSTKIDLPSEAADLLK